MLPGYMTGIEAAGGLPIMLPLSADPGQLRQLAGPCDGLLFSGGQDVNPELYGERPADKCGAICPQRDAMERALLDIALEADKPVLGICRGLQFINAALGGTLWQDLPSERPDSPINHDMKPPYDAHQHQVDLIAGTPLADLLADLITPDRPAAPAAPDGLNGPDARTIGVNSRHHQAVKRLADPLRPMAVSEDGLVEAAWMPGRRFVWGVQWHPEHAWRTDAACRAILGAFVKAAGAGVTNAPGAAGISGTPEFGSVRTAR
ncbi:gamma-glutamyl-gamma-aminobutyrate hydrolase family protein [Bifidobacterium vespertilionis]|nr:gamma-glutamyl-gamma-aminobutyrate hydrolase family protein [Bifidobacterium vespertilionis]